MTDRDFNDHKAKQEEAMRQSIRDGQKEARIRIEREALEVRIDAEDPTLTVADLVRHRKLERGVE